jgi:hypothetical protein
MTVVMVSFGCPGCVNLGVVGVEIPRLRLLSRRTLWDGFWLADLVVIDEFRALFVMIMV